MKYARWAARAALVLAGVAAGGITAESVAWIVKGAPPSLSDDANFHWAYVDIHEPWFAKDAATGTYVTKRPRVRKSSFPVTKGKNERRIFVIGESIGELFDGDLLQKKCGELSPRYDWRVINCSAGGYDSYRVALVAEEIVRYRPDAVLVAMGNNDGAHNPARINHWIYRYPVLSRFWTTRLATGALNPRKERSNAAVDDYFAENLGRILRACRRRSVPLLLCTVPINHRIPHGLREDDYQDKEIFSLLWLSERNPRKAVSLLSGPRPVMSRGFNYFSARAHERLGERATASLFYSRNVPQDKERRNSLLRVIAAKESGRVVLIDLDRLFLDVSNGSPGPELFTDFVHFRSSTNRLIVFEILRSLGFSFFSGLGTGMSEEEFLRDLASEKARFMDEQAKFPTKEYYVMLGATRNNESRRNIGFLAYLLKSWYALDPRLVRELREQKDDVLYLLNRATWIPAINRDTAWNDFLTAAGEVLREEGEYRSALSFFSEVVRTGEVSSFYHLFRGLCHYDMSERKLAEEDFAQLKKLNPRFDWLSVAYLDTLAQRPRAERP